MGSDFVVNRTAVQRERTKVECNLGGGYRWGRPVEVSYRYAGNEIEVALPYVALGLTGATATVNFKLADNLQQTGEASDFTLNGDAAPKDRLIIPPALAALRPGREEDSGLTLLIDFLSLLPSESTYQNKHEGGPQRASLGAPAAGHRPRRGDHPGGGLPHHRPQYAETWTDNWWPVPPPAGSCPVRRASPGGNAARRCGSTR